MSDVIHAAAVAGFGTEGVIELAATVGCCSVSLTLTAFEIPQPCGWEDLFPD